jgi:hypothetical protein
MQTSSAQQTTVDRLFGWWYAIAAPSASSENISVRKGKFISLVLLIEIISSLMDYLEQTTMQLLIPLTISVFVLFIGVFLNRIGKTFIAGILVVVTIEIGMSSYILSSGLIGPGLSPFSLPAFDILVQPALLAVSLFPPRLSLLIGTYNCVFMAATIFFLPKTPEMMYYFSTSPFIVYYMPISTQIFVVLVSTLWANSALREMKRATHAEEVTNLALEMLQDPAILRQMLRRLQNVKQQHSSDLNDWPYEPWY